MQRIEAGLLSMLLAAPLLAFLVVACSSRAPEPVEIALDEEACHQCRMAISQREFAAEIVTLAGSVYYFDDIGCMGRWISDNQLPETAGLFVTDYDTRSWLDARMVFYVRSNKLPTPMQYGLAAFETRAKAETAAKRLDGEVLAWQQVLEGKS